MQCGFLLEGNFCCLLTVLKTFLAISWNIWVNLEMAIEVVITDYRKPKKCSLVVSKKYIYTWFVCLNVCIHLRAYVYVRVHITTSTSTDLNSSCHHPFSRTNEYHNYMPPGQQISHIEELPVNIMGKNAQRGGCHLRVLCYVQVSVWELYFKARNIVNFTRNTFWPHVFHQSTGIC